MAAGVAWGSDSCAALSRGAADNTREGSTEARKDMPLVVCASEQHRRRDSHAQGDRGADGGSQGERLRERLTCRVE